MGEAGERSSNGVDPLIGRVINGRFRIVSMIARGGMGKVYRAEQAPLGRICALKVLNPTYDGDSDPEFHRRFFLEAATAAKLTHPNTVTIFDYGKADDEELYYIAMEYIEGKTLHRILRESGPMSEARTAHVARQVCRSLREAHSVGVVHRDLKPANILLVDHGDEHDNVKVLDFGLVKDVSGRSTEDLTQAGLFMGSPKYMAPEQIVGSGITAATDIYSLGVMLYEMLAGKVPFDKGKSVVTLMAHVNEIPPPMSTFNPNIAVSAAMTSIVARCLEKDPTKRFASMNDLLIALKRAGGDEWLTETNEALPAASVTGPHGHGPASSSGPRPISSIDAATPTHGVPGVQDPSRADHSQPIDASISRSAPHAQMFVSPSVSDTLGPRSTMPTPNFAPAWRSSWKSYFGGAVVMAAVGIGAVVLLSRGEPAAPADAAPPAKDATSAPVVVAPPVPDPVVPAVAERVVHIESDPAGASVSEEGKELCAATPCDVTWRGDDAKATTTRKLTLAKAGYQPETLKITAGDDSVRAKLAAVAVTPVRTTPKGPAPKSSASLPSGYRDAY